jgi:CubicO group peptidase (beta-lactamase class C family)
MNAILIPKVIPGLLLATVLVLAGALTACGDDEADEEALIPGADWVTAAAEDVDLDPEGIDALIAKAVETESNCLALVRDGRLVVEEYWNGTTADDDQEIFSATKSVTSTIVGIAQDEGHLSIDEPACTYLDEWLDTPSDEVTIQHLLTNTSGRYHDNDVDYGEMIAAEDRSAFSIALEQQHDPGTVWVYNNAAIQTLEEVLERATGEDVGDYAQANLFGPLGMDVHFRRDPSGAPATFFSLQAGCLDMARFGLMALRDGKWGDEQIVSADYMSAATSTANDLSAAYGYLWWVNTDEPWVSPDPRVDTSARFLPDAPIDAYAALGMFEQTVLVLPTQDMVVVRLGPVSEEFQMGLVNDLAALAVDAVVD